MTTSTTMNGARADAWRREIRSMAALAWPIVLTNLAQNAMQTTDVLMMGWLGPEALAAGTLELPAGATYRWVGRYEQKLRADAILRVIIAVSMAVMVVLIYLGWSC